MGYLEVTQSILLGTDTHYILPPPSCCATVTTYWQAPWGYLIVRKCSDQFVCKTKGLGYVQFLVTSWNGATVAVDHRSILEVMSIQSWWYITAVEVRNVRLRINTVHMLDKNRCIGHIYCTSVLVFLIITRRCYIWYYMMEKFKKEKHESDGKTDCCRTLQYEY